MKNTLRSIGTHLERGISLFEVLITVVVVSIGLLGLAGLQFAGLRAANSAQEHTLATLLAQDIEERIKANIGGANAGNYDLIPLPAGAVAPPAPSSDCFSAPCDTADISTFDALQWYNMINSGGPNTIILPDASILVERCAAKNNIKITIQWNGANSPSDPCDPDTPSGPSILVATFSP